MAGCPAGRYNGTREGTRQGGPSYQVRDPYAGKLTGLRTYLYVRLASKAPFTYIWSIPRKQKEHPQQEVLP